jgi:hypothetical protein
VPGAAVRLYPQARVAGNEDLGVEPVDHDELLASRSAGDEAHGPARHTELFGQQPQEGLVGRPTDGRCRDVGPEHPVDDAVDMI